MGEQTHKHKKVVLEAPEGGWGYLICVASILVFTLIAGLMGSFGIIYEELINKLEIGSATVVLITGANAMCLAVSGFLTSPLLRVLSFRRLAFVASLLYNAGCLGIVFAKSIIPFFICQSLLQGLGFGILYNLTCTILNEYFVKKRFFATGVVQTTTAILSMGIPLFLNAIYNYYGYRGMLMILSASSMHLFVAVALMQPVQWHMKQSVLPETESEMKSLLVKDTDGNGIPTVKVIDIDSLSTPLDKNVNDDMKKPTKQKEDAAIMKIFKEVFDVYLIKTYLPSYASMGLVMALFADFLTCLLLPQTLYAANWSNDDTAFAVSLMNFGDLFARVVFILCSKHITIQSKELHMIGVAMGILPRVGLLLTKNGIAVLVMLFVIGLSRCFLTTILPLIIGDAVPAEKFTAAMGMFMLLMGVFNLALGSAAGAVRDLTGTYDTTIWISIIILILTITQGLLETLWLKRQKKKFVAE